MEKKRIVFLKRLPSRALLLTLILCLVGVAWALCGHIKEVSERYFPRLIADAPAHEGMQNALDRFAMIRDLTYEPLRDIPQRIEDIPQGEEQTGLPYSSTRPEALFVPNNVSLYTFFTALHNPNSYLYSVDLGEEPYKNVNGDTYYGAVCSTSAAYALGITHGYSTHDWTDIPGMSVFDAADAQALALCDTIVGEGHVVMITGILRARADGKTVKITVSEASGERVKQTVYTPEELFARYPREVYAYCRYEYLKDVPPPAEEEYARDLPLIPRKGDKANWLYGTNIEIDVLAPDGYTEVRVYREGKLYEVLPLSPLITLCGLAHGGYTACLANGEGESRHCAFFVADVASSARAVGDGNAEVTFSAPSGTEALWVQWAGRDNGTKHISVLSPEEKTAGYAVCAHESGHFKIRVAFRTPYGIVHSALPDALWIR